MTWMETSARRVVALVASAVLVALALVQAGCPNELELKRKSETRYKLAADAYARKDYSTAVLELERALELYKKNADAHYLMGLYYMIQRNDFANAEKHLKLAVEDSGGSLSKAKNALGLLYLNAGRVDESIPLFEDAIADIHYYKESFVAHVNLGRALAKKERLDDAINNFNRALMIEPKFCAGYYHRAEVKAKLGDLEAAARDYASATTRDPECKGFTDAHFGLGETKLLLHKNVEAAAAYADCVASAPESTRAAECREKLRVVCLDESVRAAATAACAGTTK